MNRSILIGAALLLSAAWAGAAFQRSAPPAPPPVKVDLSSPEATVRSMVAALARNEVLLAARCIVSPAPEATLRKWEADLRSSKNPFFEHLTLTRIEGQPKGSEATVTVHLELRLREGPGRAQETVKLRKVGTEWKIVPPTRAERERHRAQHPQRPTILADLTSTLADPEPLLAERRTALESGCRLRVEYLCTSASQHADDHEGKYLLTAANWRQALAKYVDWPNAHRCPAHHELPKDGSSYSFNGNLTGIAESKIRDLGRTLLFYEGSGGKLDYRHGGKAIVGFGDLHAELVDPQQAANLNWKP